MCLYVIWNLGIFSSKYLDNPIVVLIGTSLEVVMEASTYQHSDLKREEKNSGMGFVL